MRVPTPEQIIEVLRVIRGHEEAADPGVACFPSDVTGLGKAMGIPAQEVADRIATLGRWAS